MQFSDHTDSAGAFNEIVLFIIICLLFGVVIYLQLYTSEPYLSLKTYQYKPSFYSEFHKPSSYDVETQGRQWCNWHQDVKGLDRICTMFNHAAGYINENPSTYNAKLCLKLWGEWILAYLEELEKTDIVKPDFKGFPWGDNWYEFSIYSTTNLAYYILNDHGTREVDHAAAKCIKYIIKDPQHSLGYERSTIDSALMLLPYTVAHMFTGTLDKTDPSFQYGVQQFNLTPDQTIAANAGGVHLDYSYLTPSQIYAYGHIWSIYKIYPEIKQVLKEVKDFNLEYHVDKIYSKLKHPLIDMAGGTLWHRARRLSGAGFYSGKLQTNKCHVIPSMRYIRYFDDDINFSARAMQNNIPYYVADQNVNDMGLYSALCRRVFHEIDEERPVFPDVGFIYPTGTTELIPTPSTTSDLELFFANLKSNSESWAWTDNVDYGLMRSTFVSLPPMLDGEYSEFLCIHLKTKILEIVYHIPVGYTVYTGDREWTRTLGDEVDLNDGFIRMMIDLNTFTHTSELSTYDHTSGTIDFTNNKYAVEFNNDQTLSYFIKHVALDRIIAYIPGENEKLESSITVNETTFTLRDDNQYWANGYDFTTQTFA